MKLLLTWLLLSLTVYAGAQNSSFDVFIKSLESKIQERLKEKKVPGMAIAIIDNGAIVYKKGIGWADVKNQIKVNPETGFNIGSISKLFTAWGIMKLVEMGKVDLDAPVEKYLSRWKLPDSKFDKSKVTIRALLSHTAGISVHGYPGFPPEDLLPSLEESLEGNNGPVRADEKVEIIIEPQTEFKYSGGGYTILQLLIEEVTQQSFAEYMHQTIFQPLKMNQTSFILHKKILKKSAKPYDEEGKEFYLERFTAQAAAGLHTNLEDLLIFAKASLEGNTILSEETMKLMRTPVDNTKGRYGLGYSVYPMGKVTVKGHAGSNTGWESGFMLDYDLKSGMIMLSNGDQGDDVLIATLRQWVKWKSGTL